MRKAGVYLLIVFIVTILIPTTILKTINFVTVKDQEGAFTKDTEKKDKDIRPPYIVEGGKVDYIKVYNAKNKKAVEIPLEDYIKGVVASEMPAKFHIEALKAQAIAARTYAISRSMRFSEGHPDHPKAPLCASTHCQVYRSKDDLQEIHGDKWIEDFWVKIEEAVYSTSRMLIYYGGEIIEPLYHSTSGGQTEDSVHVFANDSPYLKSVESPYEEEAPKFKEIKEFTLNEFLEILNKEFKGIKISKDNFLDKIKLIEKTPSGRVKKIAIDEVVIEGRDIRNLFNLNSTNFTISYDKKINLIEIVTYGYGHGVGMSQWGANGMAKTGKTYEEILKHYYQGVEIEKM